MSLLGERPPREWFFGERAATRESPMIITFTPTTSPVGKLADAELRFTEGPLEGLKLIGFAVWQRRTGEGRNVTYPARQYSVNGERRSFALLRPVVDSTPQRRLTDEILAAYAEFEARGETPEA